MANSTSPASYTPAGALAYAQLGVRDSGQAALVETRAYQSRNREVAEQVTAGSAGVYSFDMTPGGLLPNGNVTGVKDDLVGQWTYAYDGINRLIAATGVAGSHYGGPGGPLLDGQSLGWSYDGFGNQFKETATAQSGYPNVFGQFAHGATPNGNNQYVSFQYDAAGNTLYDGVNHYAIDGLDRICAVKSGANGNSYVNVYDASGHRVEKGTVNSYSNCGASSSNGFSMTSEAVLGRSGEEFAEYTPSGGWATNVYANGELLATYQGSNLYFALNDWQGTKRVIADVNPANGLGRYVAGFYNLPFGDDFGPYTAEPSSHHFTGQLYDAETYLDYFGARHYTPVWGRFMSPDPSGLLYANPFNPQSLNLYSYAQNNPLTNIDPTGKDCVYLSNNSSSIEEVDADSDTSASDCGSTGGTHVTGSLTGYGSTDPDGTINEFYSNAYGTQNGSQNGMPNPSTVSGFFGYLGSFLTGSGPTNVLYGPGNTATQQMQNTQNVQQTVNKYVQAGCPGTSGSPAPLQQGHAAAYLDSAQNPTNGTQLEVGGYSGGVYTVNGTTTFTINNPSSMSSLDGESALNGSHSTDNPNGPTGAGHTVNQTFQWTEIGLCGH